MKPLIIFELANNHQGSLSLARQIVEALTRTKKPYESLFEFAVKFQFRDIQSFIDPDAEPSVNKHISRFRSTQLSAGDWANLTEQVRQDGYMVITTVFDESSVEKARSLGISTLKIASCSAQEWPLIQKAAHASDHLIVSTAGLGLDQVDALYSFLRHECRGGFTLLHCAGIYPAPLESIKLETVRRFRKRYPGARIGYSGHEAPEAHNVSATALAVGAEVIERHVGLASPEKPLNAYSLDIPYVNEWLMMLRETALLLGQAKGSDYSNPAEHASLAELRRGVFASQHLSPDMEISRADVCFRFPLRQGQMDVAEFSTIYHRCFSTMPIAAGEPLTNFNTRVEADRCAENLDRFVHRVRGILSEAHINLDDGELLEISHHFGPEQIWKYGCCIVNVLNRAYCKKLIIMTAGQQHPEQYHAIKEETFRIASGELEVTLNGESKTLKRGQSLTVLPTVKHQFRAVTDVVIEELSTMSLPEDSYYTDKRISTRPRTSRKTIMRNFIRSE